MYLGHSRIARFVTLAVPVVTVSGCTLTTAKLRTAALLLDTGFFAVAQLQREFY